MTARRTEVAMEAARLLYRREVREYLAAKQEAARRLGSSALPSNLEVQQQLYRLIRSLDGPEYERRLRDMRTEAVRLMRILEAWQPRLIGSVLTGHVRSGSDIDLHVHGASAEELCAALRGHGLQPEVQHVSGRGGDFTHVRFRAEEWPVELTLYPPEWLRARPLCGISGEPLQRATREQLEVLLQEEIEPAACLLTDADLEEEFGPLPARVRERLWLFLQNADVRSREQALAAAAEFLA